MNFAVIDTETNWKDEVMSLGLVIARSEDLQPVGKYYYIFTPEYKVGGVFSSTLHVIEDTEVHRYLDTRSNALDYVKELFSQNGVTWIFAYNARFDKAHLPELQSFQWFDIMKIAAYKQHNRFIPDDVECFPASGRIRKGFGVEPVYRMVTGRTDYREKHNGYHDAIDELVIMQKLNLPFETYRNSQI